MVEVVLVEVVVGHTATRLRNHTANPNNNNTVSLNHSRRMGNPHLQVGMLVSDQARVHLQSLVEGEHMNLSEPGQIGDAYARIC